jgi:hypothetical protein
MLSAQIAEIKKPPVQVATDLDFWTSGFSFLGF